MKIEEVIKQLESILDHVCSMAASPDADDIWKEDIDALEFALTALRSMQEAGEPLSLEQLKQMDGKPVWIEDTSCWGLVFIPKAGQFKNSPFVLFRKEGVQFEWHVTDSELTIYSYPLAHIDRSEWTAEWIYDDCEFNLPKCSACGCRSKDAHYGHKDNFCPKCGRAMTEKAWVELERRLQRMPLPEPPEEG